MKKTPKKLLAILAHCDDEIICGWPVLQGCDCERWLLTIAMQGKCRDALRAFCESEGINLVEHDGFAPRFAERVNDRHDIIKLINRTVDTINPHMIFTHNSTGEYGHIDHLFVNGVVVDGYTYIYDILTTDLAYKRLCWPEVISTEKGNGFSRVLDKDFWNRGRAQYELAGCWTTNRYIDPLYIGPVKVYVNVYNGEPKKTVAWLCDTKGWAFANASGSIAKKLTNYIHKIVTLKHDTVNQVCYYNNDDIVAIEGADLVVAMTPGCLSFLKRRDNVITRLSGMRSI